ncbi:MAG: hypothetical protein ACSHX7_02810 [Luteolibacter sp.]
MNDRKTKDLLGRIREDVSLLKGDVATLFSHTTHHTVPSGARDLADYGKNRLNAGSDFAAEQLRYLRAHPGQSTAGLLGGLLLLGAAGAGIYYLCKSDCCRKKLVSSTDQENDELEEIPSYISQ